MPLPLVPLIAAGSMLASSGINAVSQGSMNRKNRRFAKQQAQQQRNWALEDWALQNEYNHPSAQMQRLKEAKLNPNLVYGNGADATSGPIRETAPAQWQGQAPQIDLGGAADAGISTYYDSEIKQAQVDNLRVQNTVLEQEKLLKASQVLSTLQGTKTSEFDLAMKEQLKNISLEAAKSNLAKTKADTQYTLDSNFRQTLLADATLSENAERILNLQAERTTNAAQRQKIYAEIKNISTDGKLKELELNLRKNGISPNDPIYLRVLAQYLKDKGISIQSLP